MAKKSKDKANLTVEIDAGKNFITFYDTRSFSSVRMIRWGWFEDNIITKYTSLIGVTKRPMVTFRSLVVELDEGGNPKYTDSDLNPIKTSVRIPDHNLLRPINPSHSLIFKSEYSNMKESLKTDGTATFTEHMEHTLAQINKKMVSGNNSRQFNHPEFTSTDSKEGDGYLRNIFVNVEVIQKKFGIDIDNLGPSQGTDGYHTDGITPSTNINSSIKNILSDISANFSNFWNFDIITDVTNSENSIIVDENHQPVRDGAYSQFLQSEAGNPAQVSSLGVYQFPSMEFSSVVKNQTFEVSIPKGDQAVYVFGANSNFTEPSSDIDIRSVQNFAAIQGSDRNLETEQGGFAGLGRFYTQYPNGGYPYGNEGRKLKFESDFNHKEKVRILGESQNPFISRDVPVYWRKYSPSPTAKSGKVTSNNSNAENRSTVYNDNRYQYVTEKPADSADSIASIASSAINNVGDAISTVTGKKSSTEPIVKNTDEAKATNKISGDILVDNRTSDEWLQQNISPFLGDNGGNATVMETYLAVQEEEEKYVNETGLGPVFGEEAAKAKKVVTVTAQTEDIKYLYHSVDEGGSNHPLENMRLKASVRKYNSTLMNSSGKKGRSTMPPFKAVNLGLTIDGISGLFPGNMFNVSYVPAKYNKNFVSQGISYGPLMNFRIEDLKQEVTVDGWNTSFGSIGLPNNDAIKEFLKLNQEAVDDFFSLELGRAFGTENMPLDYLGKIKDFISVIGDVADSVTNFFDAALTNQAEVSASQSAVSTAKKLADAEAEEKKKKVDTIDGEIKDASEQDGKFLQKVAGVSSDIATPAKGLATGISTIATGGFSALSDSVLNFLGGDLETPEWDAGDKNPTGGSKSNVTQEVIVSEVAGSDKLPQNIKQDVNEELGAPTSDIPASFGVRLANTVKKIKASLRKKQRDVKSPKPSERAIVLLKKIKFTHNVSTTAMSGDSNVQVETIGKFKEKEETFITAEMAGSSVNSTRKRIEKYNEQVIAARFASEFPDEEIAENEGSTKQNPGYPFVDPYYSTEPFGSHANRADARAALASAFRDADGNPYTGYTAYKNDYQDDVQRKEHWDSTPAIW